MRNSAMRLFSRWVPVAEASAPLPSGRGARLKTGVGFMGCGAGETSRIVAALFEHGSAQAVHVQDAQAAVFNADELLRFEDTQGLVDPLA
jgi:hypothetical protein